MKNKLIMKIAWLLPPKLVYWVCMRAWADATQMHTTLTPTEITFDILFGSLEKKYNLKGKI